ncbi:MAG: NifB/NifX family molybdenum-iron cluster-binding protein [Candidatus Bathyarchaeia archaeon]
MRKRIVIPTEDENGLNAKLSNHFGRTPYFTLVELDEEDNILNIKVISNASKHFGGLGKPSDILLQLHPNALITYGIELKALTIFQQAQVVVLKTNANTVKEIIEAYRNNKLKELTEGCHHNRYKER